MLVAALSRSRSVDGLPNDYLLLNTVFGGVVAAYAAFRATSKE